MSTHRFWNFIQAGLCSLFLVLPGRAPAATETNAPAAEAAKELSENSVSNDTLRAYLQLQEQMHETQLAIERTRRETQEASLKNAEALANQLRTVEQSLASQRTNESHFMVIVLSVFAALSFMAVVVTAYFQWRTVNRLAEFSTIRPAGRALAALPAAAMGNGENHLVTAGGAVEPLNGRLLGAIERLEKRILELENTARPVLNNPTTATASGNFEAPPPITSTAPSDLTESEVTEPDLIDPDKTARIRPLLDEGQSLLNEDKAEEAIERFDQVLALDPQNTDALVKKGTALEKMRKLPEAIECYDRAIASDSSMTIAYLYKGGLYNRMERFGEAVECYEQALRTQEKRTAA